MPTIDEALQYLGIDYPDEVTRANAARALHTAYRTMLGGVGSEEDVSTYLADDPRVTELVLIYTDDLYSNRGVSAKVSGTIRRLVHDIEQQLKMELRTAKAAAEEAVRS